MADSSVPLIEICTTGADGVRNCIQQSAGVLIFGSPVNTNDVVQGLTLMLVAYFAGYAMAALKAVFFTE